MTPSTPAAALTLDQARRLIDAALAHARQAGFAPMGIAVLDDGGNIKAFAREDGASMFRFEIARGKAWGAVGMGVSSRALAQRAKDNPNFFVTLAASADGRFLPQPGAVLIKDATGRVLGAVGASGGTGDEDEQICIAGIEAIGLKHG
ncbi:MAG: heme-binding protein [Lautropia sp.]